MSKRPLIGITACRQIIEPHYFHVVGEKYIDAVVDGAEGVPLPLPALAERLQLAMDNGAKRVLIPSENKRDFADIPSDVLDKLQIIFFSDPVNAAFRAMGVE